MTLPDSLRGGAWPSPVRAVRCPVKSGNERNPNSQLRADPFGDAGHSVGTAIAKMDEGLGHGRSVSDVELRTPIRRSPESPGPHADCKGEDNGLLHRKVTLIPKPRRS
jgi:hypothetical protein